MKKSNVALILATLGGALGAFYGVLGTPTQVRKAIEQKDSIEQLSMTETADKLMQITKDSFAPETKEQYSKSYAQHKGMFFDGKAESLYGADKDVIPGVETENEDVIYTSSHGADEETKTMYRVSMTLVGRTGRTPIEVYYYISEGKIFDVVVMKGGAQS